jgi:hypothetical protein
MEEIAWRVVPEEPPPEIQPWVEYSLRETKLERRVVMAYLWANRLLQSAAFPSPAINNAMYAAFELSVWSHYEIADISAGFIPIQAGNETAFNQRSRYLPSIRDTRHLTPSAETKDLYWTFGIVVGLRPLFRENGRRAQLIERQQIREFRDVDGFPVICELRIEDPDEKGAFVRQHAPAHPAGAATSACYVKPIAGKRFYGPLWSDGILIARHVLGGSAVMGTHVTMVSGGSLPVADIDSGSSNIDAAVLDAGAGAIPAGTVLRPIYPAIAPGLTVDVAGSHTTFTATVLRVMDDSKYFGNTVAHRAFLDKHGVSGDSGALVTGQATGDAIGLYIAQVPGPPDEGLVQLMRQVTKYFDVELY